MKIITKDNTIRTVVRIIMLMFILLAGSSVVLASTDDGYWTLIEVKKFDRYDHSDLRYPISYSGEEGAMTLTAEATNEDGKGSVGRKVMGFSWTLPPKTLIAGETLKITLIATSIEHNTGRFMGTGISANFDIFGMEPGYGSGGESIGIDIEEPVGTARKLDGELKIPSFGSGNSRDTNKMQFRVRFGEIYYTYIYEWVPKSVVTSSPTTSTTTTVGSNVILNTWNKGTVSNNAQCRPTFTVTEDYVITYISTYHWNNGQDIALPGAITLFNLDDGKSYGTWPAEGEPDTDGAPNALWVVRPDIEIPAGRYEIADSDPTIWSNNKASNGCGFSKVEGTAGTHRTVLPAPVKPYVPPTTSQTSVIQAPVVKTPTQTQIFVQPTPIQIQTVPTIPVQNPAVQAPVVVNIPNVGIIAVISIILIVYTLRIKR